MKADKSLNANEITKLKKLFSDHYQGDPWIDITLLNTLKNISADQASEKIGSLNSIWQIVNHMILWRKALLRRVKGNSISVPANNFITEVKDKSEKSWKKTFKDLEDSQKNLLTFLSRSKDSLLENISPASGYSYYELLVAILLHDTYHIGQIVLIKKLIEKK